MVAQIQQFATMVTDVTLYLSIADWCILWDVQVTNGFIPKTLFFCKCNSVRIGQNIQNEVSVERSIFTDVVAYQLISLNWTLTGSKKENMYRSIWNENDQSRRQRV